MTAYDKIKNRIEKRYYEKKIKSPLNLSANDYKSEVIKLIRKDIEKEYALSYNKDKIFKLAKECSGSMSMSIDYNRWMLKFLDVYNELIDLVQGNISVKKLWEEDSR